MRSPTPDYFNGVDDIDESVLASIPLPGDSDTGITGHGESSTLTFQDSSVVGINIDALHLGEYCVSVFEAMYGLLSYDSPRHSYTAG